MARIGDRRHIATGLLGCVVAIALSWLAGSAWSMPDTAAGPLGQSAVVAHHTSTDGGGWGVLHHSPGAQSPAVVHGGPLPQALAATAGLVLLLVALAVGLLQARHRRRLPTVWLPTMRGPPVVFA